MIPRERTARTNGTIAHGSRFARQKRLEGQTARGRRHQPQSEAVISGHGRPQPKRRRESGNRDSRTAERPALTIRPSVTDGPPAVVPSTGTSWTGPNGGPWGVRGLGPTTPGIRRDRTWPGQSQQACVTWTERTRGSGARAPARRRPCQAKAALREGGVARIRGRDARSGLLVEDFLFHAAAAPISTRPPFLGSLGPTERDARCPYVSGAAARAFAHSAKSWHSGHLASSRVSYCR